MTPAELQTQLEELDNYSLSLDDDPSSAGLDSFNKKISWLDQHHDRVSAVYLQALKFKSVAEEWKSDAEAAYDAAAHKILSVDEEIKKLRSADLRTAAINNQHPDLVTKKHDAGKTLLRADSYSKRVMRKLKDLESKSEKLYKQMDVVNQMLRIDPDLRQTLFEKQNVTLKRSS